MKPAPASFASTDEVLVLLAADGDDRAYGWLVRRHGGAVRALLRRMGASAASADDMAQEAFVDGWKHIRTLRDGAVFAAWIRRIAARRYVRHWRTTAGREGAEPAEAGGFEPDPGAAMDLDAGLKALSGVERLCVSLCVGAGFSHDELSKALDMPLGTVKSHVRRGMEKLKARLNPEGRAANG